MAAMAFMSPGYIAQALLHWQETFNLNKGGDFHMCYANVRSNL